MKTSGISTQENGKAGSTLSQVDFLAKTFQAQTGMQLALPDSEVDFGGSTPVLYTKSDLSSSLLKTVQTSLEKDSKRSYLTFPKSGMMRNGNVYQRKHLDTLTKGLGYSLLPTPQASDNRDRGTYLKTAAITRRVEIGKQIMLSMLFNGKPCPHCVTQIMGFPNGWLKTEK